MIENLAEGGVRSAGVVDVDDGAVPGAAGAASAFVPKIALIIFPKILMMPLPKKLNNGSQ